LNGLENMELKNTDESQKAGVTEAAAGQDLSISLGSANRRSIIFGLPPAILVFAMYVLFWGRPHLSLNVSGILLMVGLFIAGVVMHEAIHGLVWAFRGTKSFASIKFGMNIKALAPYAHATAPMKAGAYRLGAASPAVVLGVLPSLIGLLTGNVLTTFFGIIFLAAAAGDFLILWLIRNVPSDALLKDHPTNAGCIVLDGGEQVPLTNDRSDVEGRVTNCKY
jgi:hypothetical protein